MLGLFIASSLVLGAIACSGSEDAGERLTPLPLAAVSAGSFSTCGIDAAGAGWCWGDATFGQLGFPPDEECDEQGSVGPCATTPGAVSGTLVFSSISVGGAHACGIAAGALWCWGHDFSGQVGDGSAHGSCPSPSYTDCAPVPVRVLSQATRVSAGEEHSCALTAVGQAFCWGYFGDGRLGTGPSVIPWSPVPVAGDGRYVDISAGASSTCAVDTDGAAWCWGTNTYGQLGDGTDSSRILPAAVATYQHFTSISVGTTGVCAVSVDGTPWCWGKIGPWGPVYWPSQVSRRQFTSLSIGRDYACGVGTTGSFCWGSLPWMPEYAAVPVAFGSRGASLLDPFVAVSLRGFGGCGVTANNTSWCWGYDYHGMLGDGAAPGTASELPVRVVTSPGE